MLEFLKRQKIKCDNPNLTFAGRWLDFGDFKGSHWQGSQIRFKISGSKFLKINVKKKGFAFIAINIDKGKTQIKEFPRSLITSSVICDIPDEGEHTVTIKLGNYPHKQWSGSKLCHLKSFEIDQDGVILPWKKGQIKVGVIGDSWTSTQHDWPHLLSDRYSVYPISFGGATAKALHSQIDYDAPRRINKSDPQFDIVVIASGVNDYNRGVSSASFESTVNKLVNRIRKRQKSARIILMQLPRGAIAEKRFDKYGVCIRRVAKGGKGVEYLPFPKDLWRNLKWHIDGNHLQWCSLRMVASVVEEKLNKCLETRMRYSAEICYNTFPIPDLTDKQK